jgi:hypothetical protein
MKTEDVVFLTSRLSFSLSWSMIILCRFMRREEGGAASPACQQGRRLTTVTLAV